jgi:hypothetical protein
MKRLGWMLLAAAPLMGQRHWNNRDWRVDERETIRKTFDLSGTSGEKRLLVDNVSGFVHVTGYGGSQIQVSVEKHIYGYSNEAIQEARRDVRLEMSQQGPYARLYVDGPFRGNNGTNYRGDDYYGYRVVFDFDVQVPYDTVLSLKTINDGDIQVKNTSGDYEINGLNGGIGMEGISGSGSIHTLNGKVEVTYANNPGKPVSFRTLNGAIDVWFRPGLNADLSFERLNGEIFSDFDVTVRPMTVSGDLSSGKLVYNGGRSIGGRTGSGGPELSFHTLNGTIRLHSK